MPNFAKNEHENCCASGAKVSEYLNTGPVGINQAVVNHHVKNQTNLDPAEYPNLYFDLSEIAYQGPRKQPRI